MKVDGWRQQVPKMFVFLAPLGLSPIFLSLLIFCSLRSIVCGDPLQEN